MASTLRLEPDLEEKLRLYRALLGKPASVLIDGLVREFFECQGDAEIAEALTERAKRAYGGALEELRDSRSRLPSPPGS